jgi:predicted acylesterase/phospholipase RssA
MSLHVADNSSFQRLPWYFRFLYLFGKFAAHLFDGGYCHGHFDIIGGPSMQKEQRFAVVLNGGVSLAVWMGGVTHELNLARIASQLDDEPQTDAVKAWKEILDAAGLSIEIDLVAGTSAGGLNGSLLATAVARGVDLPDMRTVWKDVASLDTSSLLRNYENSSDKRASPASVLDGDYFRDEIVRVIDETTKQPAGWTARKPRDCALLVTATALNSSPIPARLEDGGEKLTVDGRRVYRFERKGLDSNDFETNVRALCWAARASASYPVAFEPIWEWDELANQRVVPESDSSRGWLADGGLLDNAPFEPLLAALKERPFDKPFTLTLLYVTPGVTRKQNPDPSIRPTWTRALGWVASSIREPDERLDRDALSDAFSMMAVTQSQPFIVIRDYLADPAHFGAQQTALRGAASTLAIRYAANRAQALEDWLVNIIGQPSARMMPPPAECSNSPLYQQMSSLAADLAVLGPDENSLDINAPWRWGVSTADRILRWWGRALTRLPNAADNPNIAKAMEKVGVAQRKTSALWDQLVAALKSRGADPQPDELVAALREFLYDGNPSVSVQLRDCIRDAAQDVATQIAGVSAENLIALSLYVEVISNRFFWGADEFDAPVFHYQNLTPAARSLIDLGPLGTKDDWSSLKLYGERWGHFGAFAGSKAREHDWLWGRIDGASQLSSHLLRYARVDRTKANALQQSLIDAVLAEEGPVTRQNFTKRAIDAYLTTSAQLLGDMIKTKAGKQSLKSLAQTLLLMNPPKKVRTRWLYLALLPWWPGSTASWKLPNRLFAWPYRLASSPLRSLAFFLVFNKIRRAAKRSRKERLAQVGADSPELLSPDVVSITTSDTTPRSAVPIPTDR